MVAPEWFPDWRGDRCVIVASGPSAADEPLTLVRDRVRVIVINTSWRLAPFADVLYAFDAAWWQTGAGDEFRSLKVSGEHHPGVARVNLATDDAGKYVDDIILDRHGVIGAGAGSGFQALNLAVQFGSRDIALVGFDARVDLGLHWHGAHRGGLSNPHDGTAGLWRAALDRAAPDLAARGVSVVNCSARSALQSFCKQSLADWLGEPASVAA